MQSIFKAYGRLKHSTLQEKNALRTNFFKFIYNKGYKGFLRGVSNISQAKEMPCSPCCKLSKWILTNLSPNFKFTTNATLAQKYPISYFWVFGPWPVLNEIKAIDDLTDVVKDVRYVINVVWLALILIFFFVNSSIAMFLLLTMIFILSLENISFSRDDVYTESNEDIQPML